MRARSAAWLVAPLLLLAACDIGRPASLEITGDTLIYGAKFGLPDGQENANCGYRLTARAQGKRRDTVVIKQGRVTYSFLDNNAKHLTWEWTPERLGTIWARTRLGAGDTAISLHHDLNFSLPFRPVKGEVVFNYTLVGDDSVRSTDPFIFTCR